MKLNWSQRWKIALLLALAGLVFMALALQLDMSSFNENVISSAAGMVAWFVASAFVGAFLAGLIVAPWFGRVGRSGWIYASLSAAIGTALGGAIGGTCIVPVYGTVLGAVFVLGQMMKSPLLIAVWLAMMIGIHLVSLRLRQAGP